MAVRSTSLKFVELSGPAETAKASLDSDVDVDGEFEREDDAVVVA